MKSLLISIFIIPIRFDLRQRQFSRRELMFLFAFSLSLLEMASGWRALVAYKAPSRGPPLAVCEKTMSVIRSSCLVITVNRIVFYVSPCSALFWSVSRQISRLLSLSNELFTTFRTSESQSVLKSRSWAQWAVVVVQLNLWVSNWLVHDDAEQTSWRWANKSGRALWCHGGRKKGKRNLIESLGYIWT